MRTVLDALLNKIRRANAALPFEYFGVLEHTGPLTSPDPAPFTETDAIAWFDSERSTFVPAIRAAAQNGLHDYAWRIAAAWGPYLDMRAGFDDWNESHQQGLLSAIACGDRRGEAIMHRNLGQLALYQDDWDPAWRHLTRQPQIFAEVGDRLGHGITAVGLGTWLRERGRPRRGADAVRAGGRGVRRGRRRERRGGGPDRDRVHLAGPQRHRTAGRYLAEAFLLGVRPRRQPPRGQGTAADRGAADPAGAPRPGCSSAADGAGDLQRHR